MNKKKENIIKEQEKNKEAAPLAVMGGLIPFQEQLQKTGLRTKQELVELELQQFKSLEDQYRHELRMNRKLKKDKDKQEGAIISDLKMNKGLLSQIKNQAKKRKNEIFKMLNKEYDLELKID